MRLTMAVVVALSLGLSGECLAQERYVKPREGEFLCYVDHVGTWKEYTAPVSGGRDYGLTLAQTRPFHAKIASVAADLRRLPVFNPMKGIRAELFQDFCCNSQCQVAHTCSTIPAHGRIWMLLPYYYTSFKPGTPFTDPENRAELEITFNNPEMVFNGGPVQKLRDGRRAVFEPAPFRKIGPVTLYFNQGRGDVFAFLTRADRPLWLPVSQGEFLEALVAEREATLTEGAQGIADPKMVAAIRNAADVYVGPLRAQLRGLSPAARAAQAWVSNPELGVVPPNSPDARPLVSLNPNYFDRARPRTDIQLIVLRFEGLETENPLPAPPADGSFDVTRIPLRYCSAVAGARLWELANQLDWSRLQALLD